MGSDSDLPVMSASIKALEEFGISAEMFILSAHRLPDETAAYARGAASRGIEVIIAGAGAAAHLAGATAALTPLPVVAVPLSGSPLGGVDALYAMVQMPRGVPVATVAVDGAYNAGILAAQIIGVKDGQVREKIVQFKEDLARRVKEKNELLQQCGYKKYLRDELTQK